MCKTQLHTSKVPSMVTDWPCNGVNGRMAVLNENSDPKMRNFRAGFLIPAESAKVGGIFQDQVKS